MEDDRLDNLKRLVQKRPVVLFRFEGEKWSSLRESRRGANEFTIARSHELFEKVRVPIACLIIGKDGGRSEVFLGVASSRSAVTTLESRIKVKRALHIQPSSKAGIVADNRFVPATRGSQSLTRNSTFNNNGLRSAL